MAETEETRAAGFSGDVGGSGARKLGIQATKFLLGVWISAGRENGVAAPGAGVGRQEGRGKRQHENWSRPSGGPTKLAFRSARTQRGNRKTR